MATVEAICISSKKGIVKKAVDQAIFVKDFGITDDAHAGKWHRQVSLLAAESIDIVKQKLPTLKDGAFAENIITKGLDITTIKVGDQLQIGESIILEITQIGKKCHNDGCAIKKATGDCIMPKEGLFATVIQGGTTRAGDTITPIN
ncbi:MAG: MOSC domain-containing protein [Proteobacteria bacterium]|nr:MOSC domain-containing protein [Pseudomonadota bacterium]MBU1641066.1 MOSC domain-containing protein [Pseudomonadota bacterium]